MGRGPQSTPVCPAGPRLRLGGDGGETGFFLGGGPGGVMDIFVLPYETRAAFGQIREIRVCRGNPALVPSSLRSLFVFYHQYDTARMADKQGHRPACSGRSGLSPAGPATQPALESSPHGAPAGQGGGA